MEIKRASMISTPPVTPRNSVFLTVNQSHNGSGADQMELQKFLQEYQVDDAMSIPEVEETESDQHQREETIKTPVYSSGTATPEETPSLALNTNNNSNSPSLVRSSLTADSSPSSSLVTGSPSSLVAGRSSAAADSPRSLDRLSTGSSSPSSAEAITASNRWIVPARSLDKEEGVISSSNGIPKSRSADDVLDERRVTTALATKPARKSLFGSSSSSSSGSGGGKWRSRSAGKVNKPSMDDLDANQPARGRAMSLFTFPPPAKPAKKSGSRKFSLKWRRGNHQPVQVETPLPTLQEVPVHLSQDMQAYAFDTLSQPQPLDPDSLTCPSAGSTHWNEYGFVQ